MAEQVKCASCGKELTQGLFVKKPRNYWAAWDSCSACGGQMCSKCKKEHRVSINHDASGIGWIRILSRLGLNPVSGGSKQICTVYQYCSNCAFNFTYTLFPYAKEKFIQESNWDALEELAELNGDFQLADEARAMKRTGTLKVVNVDLNALIEQVRLSGIVVPFKCPNCGASIAIDQNSRAEGLKFCSYCGSTVDVTCLSSIIQQALK